MKRHILCCAGLIGASVLMIGCGTPSTKLSSSSGDQSATVANPQSFVVQLSPSTATLTTGQTLQWQAPFISPLLWMVNGKPGGDSISGSIDANGNYTAPVLPPAGPVVVTAQLGSSSASVGHPSATATIQVVNAAPQLAQLSPSAVTASSPSQVVLTGSGFNPLSTVSVNGQSVNTTYIDGSHLQVALPATNPASSVLPVTVSNPAPGGGTSSALSLFAGATGTPRTTSHPLVAKLSSVLPAGASMFAEFGPDTSYAFKTSAKTASGGSVDLLVAGMQPSKSYHMRLHFNMPDGSETVGEDEVFTSGDVPAARIPVVRVTRSSMLSPSPGIELLDFVSGNQQQLRVAAVDLSGNLIWYYDYPLSDGIPLPVKQLSDGNIGITLTRGQQLFREVDLTGQVVRQITVDQVNAQLAAAGSNIVLSEIHHDFAELPNGIIVLITSEIKNFDNLPGFPGTSPVLGDVLVALDSSFKVIWTWSSFDHLDVNRHPWFAVLTGQLPETVYDWTHSNAVVYSARDKALLVSMRHQNWILKIDFNDGQGTGDVLWKLGPGGDFTLLGGIDPVDWFYDQHYPSFVNNDGPMFDLALFDNGNLRQMDSSGTLCGVTSACYSRPVVMTIDETNRTATLKWDPHTLFSNFGGVIRALDSNRIEYTFSSVPGTSGGRVVESTMGVPPIEALRLDTGQACYRAVRLNSLYAGTLW